MMKRIFFGIWGFLFFVFGIPGENNPVYALSDMKNECSEAVNSLEKTTINTKGLRSQDLFSMSAVLMDADSKRVLWEKNSGLFLANASTTKIMTCILVLELGNSEDVAEVSAYAASQPKVKLYAKCKESFKVGDLLYSLMLESHNDTAVILAEYIGKQYLETDLKNKATSDYTLEESKLAVKKFVNLMNRKAKELECNNTYFITPNGLDACEYEMKNGEKIERMHGTCAEDLAKIMAYCVKESPKKEEFMKICRTGQYSFGANHKEYRCTNHNELFRMMDGVLAGKTGFTNKAGYCYVAALESKGRTYSMALLGCGWPNNRGYKWKDSKILLNYGCEYYQVKEIRKECGQNRECMRRLNEINEIPVLNGFDDTFEKTVYAKVRIRHNEQDISEDKVLMRADENVNVQVEMSPSLNAPVNEGETVGNVMYYIGDELIAKDEIETISNVRKAEFIEFLRLLLLRFCIH